MEVGDAWQVLIPAAFFSFVRLQPSPGSTGLAKATTHKLLLSALVPTESDDSLKWFAAVSRVYVWFFCRYKIQTNNIPGMLQRIKALSAELQLVK